MSKKKKKSILIFTSTNKRHAGSRSSGSVEKKNVYLTTECTPVDSSRALFNFINEIIFTKLLYWIDVLSDYHIYIQLYKGFF